MSYQLNCVCYINTLKNITWNSRDFKKRVMIIMTINRYAVLLDKAGKHAEEYMHLQNDRPLDACALRE